VTEGSGFILLLPKGRKAVFNRLFSHEFHFGDDEFHFGEELFNIQLDFDIPPFPAASPDAKQVACRIVGKKLGRQLGKTI